MDNDIIEMPVELMREAVNCLIPYLAVSREDRSNSIEKYDYSRKFIEALIEEIIEGEPFCDHEVGICACGAIAILDELKLRLNGQTACPQCYGEGWIDISSEDYRMKTCPKCLGRGVVNLADEGVK